MCGIVGYWSWAKSVSADIFSSMLFAQAHRGPDGCGLALWSNPSARPLVLKEKDIASLTSNIKDIAGTLGLGHNWLAIQDRSTRAQMPMFSDDRRYCLVYNGEIYNFREIREQLIKDGHSFTTHSDTEVLLKAWQIKGPDIVKSLRGMFAFLLYDSHENTLYAVRDQIGIKPLYYFKLTDGIAFASEMRTFHASGIVKRTFDDDAVMAFLLAGINKPGETLTVYEGIREIPPGNILVIKENHIEREVYALFPELHPVLTDDGAIEAMRNSIIDSVNVHLLSERPVATCMSGGLDSTNIAAAIRHRFPDAFCPYKVFTLGMSSGEDPELSLALQAARALGIPHRIFRSPLTVPFSDVVDMVITCESPNHVIGPINQYLLLRHISDDPDDIRVVLDGQGGDELMSGYPWYSKFLLDEIYKTDPGLAVKTGDRYNANIPLSKSIHDGLLRIFHDPEAWVQGFDDGMSAFFNYSRPEILQMASVKYYLSNSDDWKGFRLREYFQGELQYLLRQEDRIGMRFGIECRVPFVDIPTIETAALLKPEFLIRDGFLKYPFRVLFPNIPDNIRWNTQKRGFWDVSNESFPYLRCIGEKAASDSPYINKLVQQRGGNVSDIKKVGPSALWRLLQIAILEKCTTVAMGQTWSHQFEKTCLSSSI
jgi:asparagine synthase (glutamine-hydrolysing)